MAETHEEKFRRMTEEPVGKLIGKLAVPCIISMLVTSFYNMADTFFVGMLNSNAATGAAQFRVVDQTAHQGDVVEQSLTPPLRWSGSA